METLTVVLVVKNWEHVQSMLAPLRLWLGWHGSYKTVQAVLLNKSLWGFRYTNAVGIHKVVPFGLTW